MVRGRNISAEIEAPQTVEIPRKRRNVDVVVRVSLHNTGEEDFVAHARSDEDAHFWHVLDENQLEVMRQKKKRAGAGTVKIYRGVHSYRTETIAGGHCVHDQRTLTLDGRKLEEGRVYTVRGEIYGHAAETTFVAVSEAPPRPKKGKKKPAAAKAKKKKKRPAAKKAAPKRKAAVRKRPARKAGKKAARGRKK